MLNSIFNRKKAKPMIYMIEGTVTVATLEKAEAMNYSHEYIKTELFADLHAAVKKFSDLGQPFRWLYYPKERRFETYEVFKFELCKDAQHTEGCSEGKCKLAVGCYRNANRL